MSKSIPIQLQSSSPTQDATGQPIESWSTYETVMGSAHSLRGSSYYAAEQTANETVLELYIWFRSDVLPKHRAIVGGVTYEMATPPENLDMENRELLLRLRYVE